MFLRTFPKSFLRTFPTTFLRTFPSSFLSKFLWSFICTFLRKFQSTFLRTFSNTVGPRFNSPVGTWKICHLYQSHFYKEVNLKGYNVIETLWFDCYIRVTYIQACSYVILWEREHKFDTDGLTDRQADRQADRYVGKKNYPFLVYFQFLEPPEKVKHLTPASRLRVKARREKRGRNEEQWRLNKWIVMYSTIR